MDILDRLLGHDAWTTRQLLSRCAELTPERWQTSFDIGRHTLPETFRHIVSNMEGWTAVMLLRPLADAPAAPAPPSPQALLERLGPAARELADVSRRIQREGREDELFSFKDHVQLSYGGVVAHVITHSMHHRAQAIYMMKQLGMTNLPEGDVLGWEEQAFGWS